MFGVANAQQVASKKGSHLPLQLGSQPTKNTKNEKKY